MADYAGLFDILERRNGRGRHPLNENHWSNVLAWLLDPSGNSGVDSLLLTRIADSIGLDLQDSTEWQIAREKPYSVNGRLIDIEVSFSNGVRWLIENKIDPANQDSEQIIDEASLLTSSDALLVIAPNDLTSFVASALKGKSHTGSVRCISWRTIAEVCKSITRESSPASPTAQVILNGIAKYWMSQRVNAFERMVLSVAEKQGWSTFYPDDFKEAFVEQFPDVWAEWVEQRGETGTGNAKWYLTTRLSGLARRQNGMLELTGNERAPKDPTWKFSPIYEYRLMTHAKE